MDTAAMVTGAGQGIGREIALVPAGKRYLPSKNDRTRAPCDGVCPFLKNNRIRLP